MISSFSKQVKSLSWFSNFYFSAKKPAGNLYTWGSNTSSIGFQVPRTSPRVKTPTRITQFDGNVTKVSMGNNHTAVITAEGELWTFGSGSHGLLGHNDDKDLAEPKRVDFFVDNGAKVVDVACGDTHTVCLTDDGDVWTWGSGGKEVGLLVGLFFPSFNALGHGGNAHRYIPTPIQSLRENPPSVAVTSGLSFAQALNADHDLYSWGRGEFAVFGDGSNSNRKTPEINESLQRMKMEDGLKIKKMKSCQSYTMAVMNDGSLWGWGSNEAGQIGVKTEIGIELYETANYPQKVASEKFTNQKVIDFALGENIAIFFTDSNEVYWMGLRLAYEPQQLILPTDKKVVNVGASHKSVAVVTEDGKIYCKNNFMEHIDENLDTGILTADISAFSGGRVVDIGGSYRNRYAIVEN